MTSDPWREVAEAWGELKKAVWAEIESALLPVVVRAESFIDSHPRFARATDRLPNWDPIGWISRRWKNQ